MFFTRNPVRINVRSIDKTGTLNFKDAWTDLEYWHRDEAAKPARLTCVRSFRRATEEELSPDLWELKDLHACGRLRIVRLRFKGEEFMDSLEGNTIFRGARRAYEEEFAKLQSKPESNDDSKHGRAIAALKQKFATHLREVKRAADEPQRRVYSQYNAIVRQESCDLTFEAEDRATTTVRLTTEEPTTIEIPNTASLIVQLN